VQLGRLGRLCGWWPLITMVLLAALFPEQAQKAEGDRGFSGNIEVKPSDPIPKKGYASWSLFLVCNPAWFLEENQANLRNLYVQFNAFGRAIGPAHLAVWFWKQAPRNTQALGNILDENRHNKYCTKFGLLPSKSPHVLVTTTHPDSAIAVDRNKVILELNGTNATDIQILLLKLADQLVVQGLQQADLDSEAYWRTWRRGLELTYAALAVTAREHKSSCPITAQFHAHIR
jgi:hypothetical protein